MKRRNVRTSRNFDMAAATAAMLMVTSAAFGAGPSATVPSVPPASEPAPTALFKDLDENRDGFVTRAEAERVPRLAAGFAESDADRDGRLSQSEFVKAQSIYDRALVAHYARDSMITARVKARLLKDPEVSGLDVSVKTYDGVVLLSGKVDDRATAERARKLARGVRGVVDVRDEFVMSN